MCLLSLSLIAYVFLSEQLLRSALKAATTWIREVFEVYI